MGPGLSVSRRNQWHRDGIGADVRWRSCAINKRLGEVISNLATVFLFVTLLGKQSASQEGLGIGRQKFKGDAGVMGWRQEGIWLGQGSCCPQLSCPCPSQTREQPQVRRPPRRKERERRGGSNTGCRPEESGGGAESAYMRVCVLRQHTLSSTPLPCSHTHRDSVTRRPFGLWYIYMLGAVSAQRGRPARCTWANINILHKEPLMCGGQSPRSAPLSGLGSERGVCRVNRGVGRYWRADGSDSQPDMKAVQHSLGSGKSASKWWGLFKRIYVKVWLRKKNTLGDLLNTSKCQTSNKRCWSKSRKSQSRDSLKATVKIFFVISPQLAVRNLSLGPPWTTVESS